MKTYTKRNGAPALKGWHSKKEMPKELRQYAVKFDAGIHGIFVGAMDILYFDGTCKVWGTNEEWVDASVTHEGAIGYLEGVK